ncbi:MAG TPA: penicillin-binding protein 1C [Thermoanaerobaculia bacterium]|nr:penicillin-binding protein 1C [Thermoanaerobaculia bacterium]
MTRLRALILIGAVALAGTVAWVLFGPIPAINLHDYDSTSIVDRSGEVLYETLGSAGTRGTWIRAEAIPPAVVAATIAAEDRRFFSHHGIDPLAVGRAILQDLRHRAFVQGGSTITQQVAKLLIGDARPVPSRKVREAVIALRLERRYSKRAILALYLNLAPYGNHIHGVARAGRRYFGCDPGDLTVAQAAFLAALPQRPSAFNPLRNPERAAARQRHILRQMRRLRIITDAEMTIASREHLRFAPSAGSASAQHFVDRVLSAHSTRRGPIRTTLDARLQRDVQGIIAAHRSLLLRHGAGSVAVAVLDNRNGDWLAWEGSGDYYGTSFGGAIDGVAALRQPGSALKPFTYALAFENGLTPATALADVPSAFPTAVQGVVYRPQNYDGRYRGPLRARMALAGSENVPAVSLLSRIGAPALLQLLRRCGFTDLTRTADYYGLGLTLGGGEVSLEQLVRAYAAFARGGVPLQPRFLLDERRSGGAEWLFDPRTAFWITDILSDSDARAFVFGSGGALDFPFPVAVKTGTSQAYRDNWTIGYTREVTVGVWVGNFDRRELRNSSGVTGAGPIFHAVMLAALARAGGTRDQIVPPPSSLEQRPVCATSGLHPSLYCPAVAREWLPSNAAVEFCSWHQDGYIRWPAEYRSWAQRLETTVRTKRPDRPPRTALRIENPPDGATYLIDPTLREAYQKLQLRSNTSRVAWRVDGKPVRTAEWALSPGRHEIVATDGRGRSESVTITVK